MIGYCPGAGGRARFRLLPVVVRLAINIMNMTSAFNIDTNSERDWNRTCFIRAVMKEIVKKALLFDSGGNFDNLDDK